MGLHENFGGFAGIPIHHWEFSSGNPAAESGAAAPQGVAKVAAAAAAVRPTGSLNRPIVSQNQNFIVTPFIVRPVSCKKGKCYCKPGSSVGFCADPPGGIGCPPCPVKPTR